MLDADCPDALVRRASRRIGYGTGIGTSRHFESTRPYDLVMT